MRLLTLSMIGLFASLAMAACKGNDDSGTSGSPDDDGTVPPHVNTACESYCGEASKLNDCEPSCNATCGLRRAKAPECATELDAQLNCYVANIALCNCDALGDFLSCSGAATACATQIAAYSTCESASTTASASSTQ